MLTVEVLVGFVASGKSTYARKRASEGWIVLNDDAIVTAVHGGDYRLYSDKLKPLYKSVENQIVAMSLALGRSVVVDRALDVSATSRARWVSLARSLDARIEAIMFPFSTAEEHARRRVESDGRGISYEQWVNIVNRHLQDYCMPSISEGFDVVRHA